MVTVVDINNIKLRQEMIYLLGQIDAIRFPICGSERLNQGYYDLIESIREQYVKILYKTIGYEE